MQELPAQLIQNIANICLHTKLSIATAESCTGGILATWLTEFPGSSSYYIGGVSAYSNTMKTKFLSVKESTLDGYGAVSLETAKQMASGIKAQCGSSFGVSITGVAGPSGGTKEKPVGTVCIGLCYHHKDENAVLSKKVLSKKLSLTGDRQQIRMNAAKEVLAWLKDTINEV